MHDKLQSVMYYLQLQDLLIISFLFDLVFVSISRSDSGKYRYGCSQGSNTSLIHQSNLRLDTVISNCFSHPQGTEETSSQAEINSEINLWITAQDSNAGFCKQTPATHQATIYCHQSAAVLHSFSYKNTSCNSAVHLCKLPRKCWRKL